VGNEQQRSRERAERLLERLAALDVEVVGRLVEDQHVGARVHQDRQREPSPFTAGEPVERLLGLLAGEQEPAQECTGLVRGQPGGVLGRLQNRSRRASRRQLIGVL